MDSINELLSRNVEILSKEEFSKFCWYVGRWEIIVNLGIKNMGEFNLPEEPILKLLFNEYIFANSENL